MNPAALFEEQATECLEVAARHKERLLAVAVKLAGSQEAGMDLYQQTCLNCHDAIQRRGFTGGRYEFYLLAALKHLHYKERSEARRLVLVDFQDLWPEAQRQGRYEDGQAPQREETRQDRLREGLAEERYEEPLDEHAQLAADMLDEVKASFTLADRLAFRLSLDGLSCQQIAEHIGTKDQSWVWRRIQRIKVHLHDTFRQAYDLLME